MKTKKRKTKRVLVRKCHGTGRQGGYMLVEVMTALVISAVGITGLSAAVTTANRLGATAQQSTAITIASYSTFSHLRRFVPDSLVSPINLSIGTTANTQPENALRQNLQQVVDGLAVDFSDARSDIACTGSAVVSCRVCFHWYDSGKRQPSVDTSQGVTNRSSCQIQIV